MKSRVSYVIDSNAKVTCIFRLTIKRIIFGMGFRVFNKTFCNKRWQRVTDCQNGMSTGRS